MRLRIKFRKYGVLRFIGHLDLMRFFQKAIRRAEIDIAYTTGFSPHQIMSFAAPLGVGLSSNGEYMDIEVNSMISCQDVKKRLNEASVPGIEVTKVCVLPEDAGNAMASVAAASYTVQFREGRGPAFDMAAALPDFLSRDAILIQKETKKGCREVDLRPGIYEMECRESGVYLLLDASSGSNIKPAQVLEAFLGQNGCTLQENALLINREEIFTNTGTAQKPVFVPLYVMGDDEICPTES